MLPARWEFLAFCEDHSTAQHPAVILLAWIHHDPARADVDINDSLGQLEVSWFVPGERVGDLAGEFLLFKKREDE